MKKVFLSYSRHDARLANYILDSLRHQEIDVVTVDAYEAGSSWQGQLLSDIRRCATFVALLDHPTPNVMLELGYALGASKRVILVAGRDAEIPLDVISLPVIRFDSADARSLFQLADLILEGQTEPNRSNKAFRTAKSQLHYMTESPDYRETVSPAEFEHIVASYFTELGFRVESSHDDVYDMRLFPLNAIVELKKYTQSSRLGVGAVRQLLGTMAFAGAAYGILVTTSDFSASARELAEMSPLPIVLLTLDELLQTSQKELVSRCRSRDR